MSVLLGEIQKIKYPAVLVIGCAKRLLVLVPSLKGWATAGYFITGKCLESILSKLVLVFDDQIDFYSSTNHQFDALSPKNLAALFLLISRRSRVLVLLRLPDFLRVRPRV